MKSINELEKEIEQALIYFTFWDQQRHLPTAAQTADYFASRLQKLRRELDDAKRKHYRVNRKDRE